MINMLADKVRYVKILANENSRTILTGVGVAGTVTTAYLTGTASFKAARIIDRATEESLDNDNVAVLHELTPLSKVKMTWRLYIPPVLMGAATVTAIVAANRIASKKIAALAIAGGLSDRALQEYKAKVVERLGENKARNMQDEIAQDRVTNDVANREVIAVGTGEVLCYDMNTGRYFTSTVEDIKRAENKINWELIHFGSASLSEFFDQIGLPATTYSDNVGWNMNHQMEVVFSTTMTPDSRPCIAIDFKNPPIADYHRALHDA
jgi:hypothetical protein